MKYKITYEITYDRLVNSIDPNSIIDNIGGLLFSRFNIVNCKSKVDLIGASEIRKIGRAIGVDIYVSTELLTNTEIFDAYANERDINLITPNCICDTVKINGVNFYALKATCDDEGFIFLSLLANDQYPYRILSNGQPLNIKDIL